jgi:ribosome-associated protein
MRLDKLAKTAVAALEDIKGRDILVLDVKRMTSLFDAMIIVGADSNRHGRALSRNLQEKARAFGARAYGVEGEQGRRRSRARGASARAGPPPSDSRHRTL